MIHQHTLLSIFFGQVIVQMFYNTKINSLKLGVFWCFIFFGYPEHYLPLHVNETSDPQFLYNSLLKFLNMKLFKNVKLTDYSLIFQDLTIHDTIHTKKSTSLDKF